VRTSSLLHYRNRRLICEAYSLVIDRVGSDVGTHHDKVPFRDMSRLPLAPLPRPHSAICSTLPLVPRGPDSHGAHERVIAAAARQAESCAAPCPSAPRPLRSCVRPLMSLVSAGPARCCCCCCCGLPAGVSLKEPPGGWVVARCDRVTAHH